MSSNITEWKPSFSDDFTALHNGDGLSVPAPSTNFRKRSLPQHVIEQQKKDAVVIMTTEKEGSLAPSITAADKDDTTKLTFFSKYFCKPVNSDPEKQFDPTNRKFAILSAGFLVSTATVIVILITILTAVLATRLEQAAKVKPLSDFKDTPIRQALLENFPDPAITLHNGTWFALATNNAAGIIKQPNNKTNWEFGVSNVQLAESTNFVNWTLFNSSHDPLPKVGDWARQGYFKVGTVGEVPKAKVWAPSILQRPSDGEFILFYAASARNHSAHCVGAAVSSNGSPAGPFTALNTTLECPLRAGGAIDPAAFVDTDDSIYVAYKIDGNSIGHGGVCGNTVPPLVNTPIKLQKMMSDGVTADGEPTVLLNRQADDGPLIEAPSLVKSAEGIYFLFFSSGCTRDPSYDIKYATSKNVSGPYVRAAFPLLQTGDWGLLAPGSATVAKNDVGGFDMAFHGRVMTQYEGGVRALYTSGIEFNGTTAKLIQATNTTKV